ncbi:MAG: hypothetical protein JNM07_07920 [Phycisphaerae bacterium]|nr:hypothetical protein [Phycisphaerae bacterium]
MFPWLGRFYARRIVNINVNIVLAGLLSLLPTLLCVALADQFWGVGRNPWIVNAITFVADVVFDFLIYYILHWLANHMPRRRLPSPDGVSPILNYFKDATLIQFERATLSPLLYAILLGTQHMLIRYDVVGHNLATVLGFVVAIAVVRVIHTAWMLKSPRHLELAKRQSQIVG